MTAMFAYDKAILITSNDQQTANENLQILIDYRPYLIQQSIS